MFKNYIKFAFSEPLVNINNHTRFFSKWVSRTPVSVIPSEEYDEETDTKVQKNPKIELENNDFNNSPNFSKNIKPLTISKRKIVPKITMDMLETTLDEEGNYIYTKMKNNDSRVGTILTEVKSSKERDKKDLILLEGKRLIKDALDTNCTLKYLIFSRVNELDFLKPSIPKIGVKLYKMPYKEMQMWSNLTTCPGIMGIFQIPDVENYQSPQQTLPLTVICDNIREADNLGAILRSCSGLNCEQILLTKGCVNLWDSKVLRSACGAHFKLRIKRKFDWNSFEKHIPAESDIFIADNKIISLSSTDNPDTESLKNLMGNIPLVPYYGVKYNPNKHTVLIVGGETEGISEDSYKIASSMRGTRLNIPLQNNVDSLNVGTAFGIIGFEVQRQYLINKVNSEL